MSPNLKPARTGNSVNDGVRFFRTGAYFDAFHCFERILKREPRNALALWHMGRTLLKLGQPKQSVDFLTRAVEERPDSPETLFDLSMAHIGIKQFEEAVGRLRRITELRPDWGQAWSYLGFALDSLRRIEEAEPILRRALTCPDFRAETYNHLGLNLSKLGRTDEAAECFLKAIELQPALFQAWSNLGNTLKEQDKLDEALVAYSHALRIDPKNPIVRFNQGIVMLMKGNICQEAWLKYEFRWLALQHSPNRGFKQPLWRGEDLNGKSILLFAEQGLGDTIQFIRFVPQVIARGGTVHVEVQPALKPLMASLPGVVSVIGTGEPLPPFDFQCPFLSLPFALHTELQSIPAPVPYVHAPQDKVRDWSERLPKGSLLRVGVVWRGNPKHTNDANRSVPFEMFRPLFDVEECEFVCLQVGLTERETSVFASHSACRDLSGQIKDFADTAGIVSSLDLVVTVDTSVAHLAGAMGRPVWLLVPFTPDWRWMLDREDSPWYPTFRIFRQKTARDWPAVIGAVRRKLIECASPCPAPAEPVLQTN